MKSGNKIVVPYISDWKVNSKGNQVVGLSITYSRLANILPSQKLLVSTIDLSQIEAVTRK